jgi:hypothetical protein
MPKAMRPDRSGVVLEVNSAGRIVAHCAKPDSWRREPMRRWLMGMAGKLGVMIEHRDSVWLLDPSGSIEALEFVDIDPATNERRYKLDRAAAVR